MRGNTKEKILLLLAAGAALLLARTPKNYFKVLDTAHREFIKINRRRLLRLVHEFYNERLVDFREDAKGIVTVKLIEDGQRQVLRYEFDAMTIDRPRRWDKKWRLVIFDVPDKKKKAREALREKLKELGFHQLQKSVFVFPYPCDKEINFVVEVFEVRPYVRLIEATRITNEADLKLKFDLV